MTPYGTLTLITGPMFAGKTSELLKRILWAQSQAEKTVFVAKPAFDDRYAATRIVSHDGLSAAARAIPDWGVIPQMLAAEADELFFDEVQFLTPSAGFDADFPEIVRGLLAAGKSVTCNGLDMDWRGEPFAVTAQIAAMADEVLKLHAHCTICGRPARKTFRFSQEGEAVALGAGESYAARCNVHWTNGQSG